MRLRLAKKIYFDGGKEHRSFMYAVHRLRRHGWHFVRNSYLAIEGPLFRRQRSEELFGEAPHPGGGRLLSAKKLVIRKGER